MTISKPEIPKSPPANIFNVSIVLTLLSTYLHFPGKLPDMLKLWKFTWHCAFSCGQGIPLSSDAVCGIGSCN